MGGYVLIASEVQEVSSGMQTQGQKGVVPRQTATQVTTQTVAIIPGPNTVTNNHSNSNFNSRPDNTLLSNNNEIKYFLPCPSKESDKEQALK